MLQKTKIIVILILIFVSNNIYCQKIYSENNIKITQKDNIVIYSKGNIVDKFVMKNNMFLYVKNNIINDSLFILESSCGTECSYTYICFINQSKAIPFYNCYAIDLKNKLVATSENNRIISIYDFNGNFIKSFLLDIKVPYLLYYTKSVYFSSNYLFIKWNKNVNDKTDGSNTYKPNTISRFKIE